MTDLSFDTAPEPESKIGPWIETTTDIFLRLVSILFLALTLMIWMRAIGLWPGDEVRFDKMSTACRVYTAVVAVLFPATAVGLWTTLAWGRVVWFLALIIEVLAFAGVFAEASPNIALLAVHAICIVTYLSLRIAAHLITKKG